MRRTAGTGLVALAIVAGLAAGCSTAAGQLPGKQSHRRPAAGIGSPGNPLMLSCAQASFASPVTPKRRDLVVGPLYIINARNSVDPKGAGPNPQHGYKYPIAVRPGATVTMMIAPSARSHVVIDNPYGPQPGVIAATYQACQPSAKPGWTVFVQGFSFTDGRTRGCVPLTVRTGREPRIRDVTVSLYAGPCASKAGARVRSGAAGAANGNIRSGKWPSRAEPGAVLGRKSAATDRSGSQAGTSQLTRNSLRGRT